MRQGVPNLSRTMMAAFTKFRSASTCMYLILVVAVLTFCSHTVGGRRITACMSGDTVCPSPNFTCSSHRGVVFKGGVYRQMRTPSSTTQCGSCDDSETCCNVDGDVIEIPFGSTLMGQIVRECGIKHTNCNPWQFMRRPAEFGSHHFEAALDYDCRSGGSLCGNDESTPDYFYMRYKGVSSTERLHCICEFSVKSDSTLIIRDMRLNNRYNASVCSAAILTVAGIPFECEPSNVNSVIWNVDMPFNDDVNVSIELGPVDATDGPLRADFQVFNVADYLKCVTMPYIEPTTESTSSTTEMTSTSSSTEMTPATTVTDVTGQDSQTQAVAEPEPEPLPAGSIVAIVISVCVLLILIVIIIALLCYRRRRRDKQRRIAVLRNSAIGNGDNKAGFGVNPVYDYTEGDPNDQLTGNMQPAPDGSADDVYAVVNKKNKANKGTEVAPKANQDEPISKDAGKKPNNTYHHLHVDQSEGDYNKLELKGTAPAPDPTYDRTLPEADIPAGPNDTYSHLNSFKPGEKGPTQQSDKTAKIAEGQADDTYDHLTNSRKDMV